MSFANSENYTSSFPFGIPFIYIPSLIAMARTSKTLLNNGGEIGHSCLVLDLRGNGFNFPISAGSWKKQESSRKTSISALLTMPKPLNVWITIN